MHVTLFNKNHCFICLFLVKTVLWQLTYDSNNSLNPISYNGNTYEYEGRRLIKFNNVKYTYDLEGKRIKKDNNGKKTIKPLSGKTILEHHRLLRAMLHKAIYWQLLVSNPAERVQPPKAMKPKRRYYDDEQCKILLENLTELGEEQIKYKVAIILTIFTELYLLVLDLANLWE